MFRRILKAAAIAIGVLVATGAVLFLFFDLRVVLDGGGMPHLRIVQPADAIARAVAQDRESHRAQATASTQVVQDSAPHAAPPGDTAPRSGDAAAPPIGRETLTPTTSTPPYWTDFRGPQRDGQYRERAIRTNWTDSGLTPSWKQPSGGGYASFVIARGRAFTIEQRGPDEVVAAYDVATGRELWTSTWRAAFHEFMGGDGPRATPTWADNRVYALGGEGEFRGLDDATGRVLWRTNILKDAGANNLQWGMAAAPLIVDDTVIVLPGGGNGHSVVAYNRRTGKIAWSALGEQQGYSSPMLVTLAGVRQVLVFTATRLIGITPDRGDVLWEYPWATDFGVNAGQPLVIGENRLFVSSGYGTGAAVIELSASGGRLSTREVWRNTRMKNQFASSVLLDGYIYGLDEAILACMDATTGELKWKGGRYGYGQLLLASGHLVILTEDGDLALVRATPKRYEEVARFPVLNGKTWNPPSMADGFLLVRNLAEMAAFDLRVPPR